MPNKHPWYLQDFTQRQSGKTYDLSDERDLFDQWSKIKPDNEARLVERWDLFFELARMSPAFFIHELGLPIRTKAGRKVPFDTWHQGQRLVYAAFLAQWKDGQPVRLIVLKARQVGMSTFCAALMFWRDILFGDTAAVIMTDKSSHSGNIRDMVGIFLAHMQDTVPEQFMPEIANETKGLIQFGRKKRDHQFTGKKGKPKVKPILDSTYRCMTAASAISERSWTVHALHASEVCFWPNPESNWLGLSQAVADEPGTVIILESSADEASEFFRGKWDSAETGESGYVPIFIGWQTQTEYSKPIPAKYLNNPGSYQDTYDKDEKELVARLQLTPEQVEWRRQTIRDKCNNDPRMFKQEYPSSANESWVSKGNSVFAPEAIFHYQEDVGTRGRHDPIDVGEFTIDSESGAPVFVPREDGHLRIWKHPEAGRTYCLGVDPAEGGGIVNQRNADSSCIQVLDAESFEQVAIYSSNIVPPDYLAKQVVCISRYYSEALIVPEANAVGGTLIFHLGTLEASPIYYRESTDGAFLGTPTRKVGVYTNKNNKGPQLIRRLEEAINGKKLRLHDLGTVKQLASYTRNEDGSYGPKRTHGHDDCVMAMALAVHGINSDQLVWNKDEALGLRRAGDHLRSARDLAEQGKYGEIPDQLSGYFEPSGTSPWDY